ncbi:MAG TPA: hypothetical protein VFE84_03935, partial [Patescibacteria group bacterium]|nr:hypothetical protein [Patescibacteria group bacterium]
MATFEDVFRSVRLQAPDVPPMLARRFVQDTYAWIAARRGWQFLRRETTIQVQAASTTVVSVVAGQADITATSVFALTDIGRQFRVGSGDTFTILALDAFLAVATLDRPYTGDTDPIAVAQIIDAYYTVPSDFGRFDTIVDLAQSRRLTYFTSQLELDRIDPRRTNSGAPRLLSPRLLSNGGLPTYEWWPRPTSAGNYPCLYFASPQAMADTDSFAGVFTQRPDVFELGALARAARWPGTNDHPNAYFNLALARELSAQFEALAIQLDLRDDDVASQDWVTDEQWGRYSAWDYAANLTTL